MASTNSPPRMVFPHDLVKPKILARRAKIKTEGPGFLRLPPELRDLIYELILPAFQSVKILTRDERKSEYYQGEKWPQGKPLLLAGTGYLQLAITCRRIYSGCMRALYRKYEFVVSRATPLLHWLEDINFSRHYVRQINVNSHWQLWVRKGLKTLEQVPSLSVLKLESAVRDTTPAAVVAKDIKPLLEVIIEHRGPQGERRGRERVLDMVQFPSRTDGLWKINATNPARIEEHAQECRADQVRAEDYAREFRKEMRKLLQLSEA